MEQMDRQIKLEALRAEKDAPAKAAPHNQVNVQINDSGSKYDQLLAKLMEPKC